MKQIQIGEFTPIHVEAYHFQPGPAEIYKRIGYADQEPEEFVRQSVSICIDKSRELIHPNGGFAIFPIHELEVKEGVIKVEQTEFNTKRIIANQLISSEYISVFAGTIGHFVEQYATSLYQENDLLDYYIMNSIGSEAAEWVAQRVHEAAGEYAAQSGYSITNRFSPGYCGWDVREQFKLFSFLPADCCGIQLTDSALLNPVKSVSGIIGLGHKVRLKEYPCRKCKEEDCLYRDNHP